MRLRQLTGLSRRPVAVLAGLGLALLPTDGWALSGGGDPLGDLQRALVEGRHDTLGGLAARLPARLRDEGQLVIARSEIERGLEVEAERRLRAISLRPRVGVDARVLLGRLLEESGRGEQARSIWHRFFDDYERRRLDRRDPRVLVAVGVAARHLGSFQDASDLLRDAVTASGDRSLSARLEWGALSLENFAIDGARRDAQAALVIDPGSPEAHLLAARVILAAEGEAQAAGLEIDAALRINPRHPGALALRAAQAIESDDLDSAERDARALLELDQRSADGRRLIAGLAHLRDDLPAFERERKALVAARRPAGPFFCGVADLLVAHHRHAEARGLYEEGLRVEPRHPGLLAGLGLTLLRLGEEQQARDVLARAFTADPYNLRLKNLLDLVERVLPGSYRRRDLGLFRLRATPGEIEVLSRLMRPQVEAQWAEMTARYGIEPPRPLDIEVFADPRHYAVRVVGLPDVAATGVTFGRVVVLRSPSTGRFNWRMVLWHEVSHVFALALSRHRVPRWLAEGLAEYETERRDPTWRRHAQAELAAALAAGTLPSVGELGGRLLRARTVGEAVIVYHLAAELVGFIVRRRGFPAVAEGLRGLAAGRRSDEALLAMSGLSLPDLDRELRMELRRRLAPWLVTDGDGYAVLMQRARVLLAAGKKEEAIAAFRRAAARDPEDSVPEEAIGKLLLEQGREDEGLAAVERAARLDVHDPALPALLVERRGRRGEWRKAREAADLGAAIRPCDPIVRLGAARASIELGEGRQAIDEAEWGLSCAPSSVTALRGILARGLVLIGEGERGARLAREVLAEEPGNRDARRALDQAAAGRR